MISQFFRGREKLTLNLLKIKGADFLTASVLSETAKRDAELLLCQAFAISRASFYANNREELVDKQKEIDLYFSYLARRAQGEPIQYILGRQEFYGFEFKVGPGVLIPRPETELIVQLVNEILKDLDGQAHIAELGIGSGAISLTLAKLWPELSVDASDIETEPLLIAAENSKNLEVFERVRLFQGDLLSPLPKKDYDIIISNPPYIPEAIIDSLALDVQKEPRSALSGGYDGLEFYRRIFKETPDKLKQRGFLILEIGYDQSERVKSLAKQAGFELVKVARDGQNIERVLLWQW